MIGTIRFALGVAIVIAAFLQRDAIGEAWTGALIIFGAIVAVAGLVSVVLIALYAFVVPFIYLGLLWLATDFWDDAYFSGFVRQNIGILYLIWAGALVAMPLFYYYKNKSWFFMVKRFALDEVPADTPHPELHAFGLVDLTGSPYLAAATITEQGIILDRRNFNTVVLPWRWILSVEPDKQSDSRLPSAVVAMRNDDNDYLTLSIPWNEDLLKLDAARMEETQSSTP